MTTEKVDLADGSALHVTRLSAYDSLPLWSRLMKLLLPALSNMQADDDIELNAVMFAATSMLPGDELQELVGQLFSTCSITTTIDEKEVHLDLSKTQNVKLAFGEDVASLLRAAMVAADVRFSRFFADFSAGFESSPTGNKKSDVGANE